MTKPAKLSEITPGTVLYPDASFTCMGANEPKEVKVGSSRNLYVECHSGEHNLEGQLSEEDWDTLVGFSLSPWPGPDLRDEPTLPDNYPVYFGYVYVVDGKPTPSPIEGTVAMLKTLLKAKEVRQCDMVGRGIF